LTDIEELKERLRNLIILDEVGSDNPLGREAAEALTALEVERDAARREADLPRNTVPWYPGEFEGDIWFGHPIQRTIATHRWESNMWKELPSEEESLMSLLAEARARITTIVAQRDSALEALKPFAEAMHDAGDDGLIGDHINAWESPMAMSVTYGDFRAALMAVSKEIV